MSTCFTGTNVQILTPEKLEEDAAGRVDEAGEEGQVCACVCMCVCVCVCAAPSVDEAGEEGQECVCVCVCVYAAESVDTLLWLS
jgi:hypothetical protein